MLSQYWKKNLFWFESNIKMRWEGCFISYFCFCCARIIDRYVSLSRYIILTVSYRDYANQNIQKKNKIKDRYVCCSHLPFQFHRIWAPKIAIITIFTKKTSIFIIAYSFIFNGTFFLLRERAYHVCEEK